MGVCVKMDGRWDMVMEVQEFKVQKINLKLVFAWNVPDFHLVENSSRKKLYENYSELNLTQIIETGEEAIKKISNISSLVIEDAAEILKIIPEKNNSEDSTFYYYYYQAE